MSHSHYLGSGLPEASLLEKCNGKFCSFKFVQKFSACLSVTNTITNITNTKANSIFKNARPPSCKRQPQRWRGQDPEPLQYLTTTPPDWLFKNRGPKYYHTLPAAEPLRGRHARRSSLRPGGLPARRPPRGTALAVLPRKTPCPAPPPPCSRTCRRPNCVRPISPRGNPGRAL